MSAADLRFGTEGPAIVARLSGEIDMSNASELAASIAGSATNDLLAVVLDLSEVDYLDSAGIQMVFSLRESLRVRGQQLLLVVPDGSPGQRRAPSRRRGRADRGKPGRGRGAVRPRR